MKKRIILFLILSLFISMPLVKADCTDEELNKIKEETDNIEIIYEHLGEITKEDGSKVYNEFMVTAKNIPDDIYIHLEPMTVEKFDESQKNTLKIILTTGTWTYGLYSEKCEAIVDEIEVNLPKFNVYSTSELCEGIDPKDFEWCSKYYERNIDEYTFEEKIKAYRYKHHLDDTNNVETKEKNKIKEFIMKNGLYIILGVSTIVIIVLIITIIKSRNKRKILQ